MRPILALLTRSLREEERSAYVHIVRAAMLALILIMVAKSSATFTRFGAAGLSLFQTVTRLNLDFLILGAIIFIAPTISAEKEQQTLGLLRMTKLGPLAILLGKGLSRGFLLCILMVMQIPFTLLTIALGGVSHAQITAVYCMLVGFILLLTGVALLCSVLTRKAWTAMILTAVLLAVIIYGPVFCRNAYEYVSLNIANFRSQPGTLNLTIVHPPQYTFFGSIPGSLGGFPVPLPPTIALNPFARFESIAANPTFSGPVLGSQFWSHIIFGACCFLAAWILFDPVTRYEKRVEPARLVPYSERKSFFSPGLPGRYPILWKDFHFTAGGHALMSARAVLYGVIAILSVYFEMDYSGFIEVQIASFRLGGMLRFVFAAALVVLLCRVIAGMFSEATDRRVAKAQTQLYGMGLLALFYYLLFLSGSRLGMSLSFRVFFIILGIEMIVLASRIFSSEVRDGTWSSLILLPRTMGGIAGAKIIASATALIPAGSIFLMSVLAGYYYGYGPLLMKSSGAIAVALGDLMELLAIASLVALISLHIRHGAIPVACGIYFAIFSFLPNMLEVQIRSFSWAEQWERSPNVYWIGFFIRMLFAAVLAKLIGMRLRKLAME